MADFFESIQSAALIMRGQRARRRLAQAKTACAVSTRRDAGLHAEVGSGISSLAGFRCPTFELITSANYLRIVSE